MKSEIPIYLQLRNQIVMGIGKGEFEEGELLPVKIRRIYRDGPQAGNCDLLPGYEEKDHQEEFQEKLEEELELLSAEAKIRGMSYKDFLDYCRQHLAEWRWQQF